MNPKSKAQSLKSNTRLACDDLRALIQGDFGLWSLDFRQ